VIPPLPGEPREGFRPFRAFLDFIRPSGRLTSPQTRCRRLRALDAPVRCVLRSASVLEPGDDRRFFGTAAMDRSRVPSARSGARAVTHGACTGRNGARCTSPRSSSDFSRRVAPRSTAREAGSDERKDLEGEQSPGKDGMRRDRQRSWSSSGLGGGATPRSRRSAQVGFRGVHRQRWMPEGLARATANGKGATATVTWCGCRRGFLRGV
jgi:hypothetical protein